MGPDKETNPCGPCGKQRRRSVMAYYPKQYDCANRRRGLGPNICYSDICWLHWKPKINIITHDNRWPPRLAFSWSCYEELWLHWTKDDEPPDDIAASLVRLRVSSLHPQHSDRKKSSQSYDLLDLDKLEVRPNPKKTPKQTNDLNPSCFISPLCLIK